jgi:hypothetical protein
MGKNADTLREIQTNALWEQEEGRARRWAEIRDALKLSGGEYLTKLVELPSGGYVAGIAGYPGKGKKLMWTTVLDGRREGSYYPSDELAMLALLSRRQEDDPNLTRHVVRHAARLMNVPRADS